MNIVIVVPAIASVVYALIEVIKAVTKEVII